LHHFGCLVAGRRLVLDSDLLIRLHGPFNFLSHITCLVVPRHIKFRARKRNQLVDTEFLFPIRHYAHNSFARDVIALCVFYEQSRRKCCLYCLILLPGTKGSVEVPCGGRLIMYLSNNEPITAHKTSPWISTMRSPPFPSHLQRMDWLRCLMFQLMRAVLSHLKPILGQPDTALKAVYNLPFCAWRSRASKPGCPLSLSLRLRAIPNSPLKAGVDFVPMYNEHSRAWISLRGRRGSLYSYHRWMGKAGFLSFLGLSGWVTDLRYVVPPV